MLAEQGQREWETNPDRGWQPAVWSPGGNTDTWGTDWRDWRDQEQEEGEVCTEGGGLFIYPGGALAQLYSMLGVKVIRPGLSGDKWTGPDGEREPRANRFWLIKIMFEIYIDMVASITFICQVDRPTVLLRIKLWQENLTVATAAAWTRLRHSISTQKTRHKNGLIFSTGCPQPY